MSDATGRTDRAIDWTVCIWFVQLLLQIDRVLDSFLHKEIG